MGSKRTLFTLFRRAAAIGVVTAGGFATYVVAEQSRDSAPAWPMKHFMVSRMKAHALDATPNIQSVWDDNWDNRQAETESSETKSLTRRHLIFIRHGQYNMEGKTDAERYLTELGREQALFTALRLKEFGLKYDVLNSSTMTRAIETAGLIAQELQYDTTTMQQFDSIREGWPIDAVPGSLRHRRSSAPPKLTSAGDQPALAGDANTNATAAFRGELRRYERNAESERIEQAFRTIFYRPSPNAADTVEVYVCHANVIRYFVCRALQLDPHAWLRFSLPHASLTHLLLMSNGRVIAQGIGDAGHIPAQKRTF